MQNGKGEKKYQEDGDKGILRGKSKGEGKAKEPFLSEEEIGEANQDE
jgi:hypothetical protein